MDQPEDNALYLRAWADDIRKHNGKSVDADRLDSIAAEIERLRSLSAADKMTVNLSDFSEQELAEMAAEMRKPGKIIRSLSDEPVRLRDEIIEMCAKVAENERDRLQVLCNSMQVGKRVGKWAGGVDAAQVIAASIRFLKQSPATEDSQ